MLDLPIAEALIGFAARYFYVPAPAALDKPATTHRRSRYAMEKWLPAVAVTSPNHRSKILSSISDS